MSIRETNKWYIILVEINSFESYHFSLSPNEFRDGFAVLYLQHPVDLDGCGADFTLQHGVECKKGGRASDTEA